MMHRQVGELVMAPLLYITMLIIRWRVLQNMTLLEAIRSVRACSPEMRLSH